MKVKFYISLVVLIGTVVMSCSKSSNSAGVTPTTTTFKTTLNGSNETPPDSSKATGTANFTFNPVTKILSGTVNYSGLIATAAHIHNGAVGIAGPVLFPLGTDSASLVSPIHYFCSIDAAAD